MSDELSKQGGQKIALKQGGFYKSGTKKHADVACF
jgi:hypothetical protein